MKFEGSIIIGISRNALILNNGIFELISLLKELVMI